MPELPEVETVVRGLAKPLHGATVKSAQLYSKKIRNLVPRDLPQRLAGVRILAVRRRAKYILIDLSSAETLLIHLGMTGSVQLLTATRAKNYQPQKHDHLLIVFAGTRGGMVFSDPRRFGVLDILSTAELPHCAYFAHLGPEPLEAGFTGQVLSERLQNRKVSIKLALMNQELVVGVGNIYASEALFKARISPLKSAESLTATQAQRLCAEVKKVLRASIRSGGSTLKDYRHADGEVGFFQDRFAVYDRAGQACPGCQCDVKKTGGIKRIVQGGRSTFYCPRQQS